MIVLVTGATGFVGSRLATRLLENGHRVVAICRDGDPPRGCMIVRGDVEDLPTCERAINEHQPHQVFHLAAQAIVPHGKRDPYGTLESNVRGTYNMLEAFRRHRRPGSVMVVASSDKAYGEARVGPEGYPLPYFEGDPLEGRGPYDVSKSCADLIAQSYGREYGLPVGIVRAGNIYGPGDTDMTRIVPSTIDSLLNNQPPVITSDGSPVRNYLWIDDAVDGYLLLARIAWEDPRTVMALNLAGDEAVSVRQLVDTAIEVHCGYTGAWPLVPKVLGTRTGEINHQVLDTTRARKMGWSPKVSLRSGLARTYRGVYHV